MQMWSEIEKHFRKFPVQKKVALFLLRKGFQVNENARVCVGNIEIAHTQIARGLGIDRRVVDATAERIRNEEKLYRIFSNLSCVAFFRDVAPLLGLSVVIITPEDASKPGIIGSVASKISEWGIPIRQAIADDPYLVDDPRLTVITEGELPGDLIKQLRAIDGVKRVTII
ncbi:amino acid-binding protein [Candidatus Pyrohabitans sp.]